MPVKSSPSSKRAIPATTSSSRLRSAPSFIKVARAFSTTTLPAPRPCPLRRPLHHEVGHLPLHLRRSAPSRVSPALLGEPTPRVAPHSVRQRYPGAKAQVEGAPNAALKRRSSTVTSSRSSTVTSSSSMVTSSNDGVRVGASVEERPFRAASEQEDSRALAPVPPDLDVFHAFARASRKSTSTTSNSQNIR